MNQAYKRFNIDYELRTTAEPDTDIQFGMDFTLIQKDGFALCQLIFPATTVGNNRADQWNVDNHKDPGDIESLIFRNAETGTIKDIPTELSRRNKGELETHFAVFSIDLSRNELFTNGVSFGYRINTSLKDPVTEFIDLKGYDLDQQQKELILARYDQIKFVKPK